MGNAYENCDQEAVFIRHTQFAGSHPLCEKHAKEDENFLANDSYESWELIKKYQATIERMCNVTVHDFKK